MSRPGMVVITVQSEVGVPGTRDVGTIGGPGHVIRVDIDTERMNATASPRRT